MNGDRTGVSPRGSSRIAARLPWIHFGIDSLVWCLAVPTTSILRYDFEADLVWWAGVLFAMVVACTGQGTFGYFFGLYRRQWRYGSFDEALILALTVASSGLLLTVLTLVQDPRVLPYSVPPMSTVLTITGSVALRSFWRLHRARRNRPYNGEPAVVVGAGNAGERIVRLLMDDPHGQFIPVAIVDDDPMKANFRVSGVRVEGSIADLPELVELRGASAVIMAIPTADSDLIRRVDSLTTRAGLPLYVLPRVTELFDQPVLADIRRVQEEDLLGRAPAQIDYDAVRHLITGRRVLVTGAGGSIGSELCRQLARLEPEALMMLDRDESGLHSTQLSIEGRAMLDDPNLVLADIRDAERLNQVFLDTRPHVVFHAAALKHLPLLEKAPAEAWKTNVVGTQNVLAAARLADVDRLVNISTDKAADPTSVLGYSKRITERLTAAATVSERGEYVSVRFGNVLGSRGSVLTAFRAQADAGGPITVTDPDVTRYFMTVEEAVRLTIYAAAIGQGGEAMVLDMGQPVRIQDVAERFATQHTPPLEIVYTGLRNGEKLHEDLVGSDETPINRVHPLIAHVAVPPLEFDVAVSLVADVAHPTAAHLRQVAETAPHLSS